MLSTIHNEWNEVNDFYLAKYDLTNLLKKKNIPNEECKLLHSASDISCKCSNSGEEDAKDKTKLYHKYKLKEELTFFSEKIYVVNVEATCEGMIVSDIQTGKTMINSNLENEEKVLIYVDEKNKQSFICGMEFRPISVFEI